MVFRWCLMVRNGKHHQGSDLTALLNICHPYLLVISRSKDNLFQEQLRLEISVVNPWGFLPTPFFWYLKCWIWVVVSKRCSCSSLFGKMIQFDLRIFFTDGLVQPPIRDLLLFLRSLLSTICWRWAVHPLYVWKLSIQPLNTLTCTAGTIDPCLLGNALVTSHGNLPMSLISLLSCHGGAT